MLPKILNSAMPRHGQAVSSRRRASPPRHLGFHAIIALMLRMSLAFDASRFLEMACPSNRRRRGCRRHHQKSPDVRPVLATASFVSITSFYFRRIYFFDKVSLSHRQKRWAARAARWAISQSAFYFSAQPHADEAADDYLLQSVLMTQCRCHRLLQKYDASNAMIFRFSV